MFCSKLPRGAKAAINAKLPTKLGIAKGSAIAKVQNRFAGMSVLTVMKAAGTAMRAEARVTRKANSAVFRKTSNVREETRKFRNSSPMPAARIPR